MGVTGDTAKLQRFRENLRKISGNGLTNELAQVLGAASMKLFGDGFRRQVDPYDVPWQSFSPSTRRRRGKMSRAKLLQDTGRMRASGNFSAEGRGFRINIPVSYARVHQKGATIHPRTNVRRQLLRIDAKRYEQTGQFRFVKKGKRAILVRAKRATFGEIKIPRRQMLPEASTGGLGRRWLAVYNREALALLRRRLRVAV